MDIYLRVLQSTYFFHHQGKKIGMRLKMKAGFSETTVNIYKSR
jgi:hypothetical protein